MKRLLLLALLLTLPAAARDWYHPAHAGRDYVNPDLTPARIAQGPVKPRWVGQLVLWEGVITEQTRPNGKHELVFRSSGVPFRVHFPKKVLNLEVDRVGYRVAVKGYYEGGRQISGRSVILLAGKSPNAYRPLPPKAGIDAKTYEFLARKVHLHNPQYDDELIRTVATAIVSQSRANGIDPLFLASLIQVESAFDIDARSVSGAMGLGQLMPTTAAGLGVNADDPADNVKGAARMISRLINDWSHRGQDQARALALASYNAGPNLVRQLGGRIPRYSQTTNYVYFIGFVHARMSRDLRLQ